MPPLIVVLSGRVLSSIKPQIARYDANTADRVLEGRRRGFCCYEARNAGLLKRFYTSSGIRATFEIK